MDRLCFAAWLLLALMLGACNSPSVQVPANAGLGPTDWKLELATQLPLYGHRNWVLVVDQAYPLQSSKGMTYVQANEGIATVLAHVLRALGSARHVRPVVYRDAELVHLDESLAPGFTDLERDMAVVLDTLPVNALSHAAVFRKMDEASALFNVLVIKTNETIPYSSVFIELDCAYWDETREMRLRELMED